MSLLWTVDEDGERVHRLGSEWDGNKGAWREWGHYESEADQWQVSLGATWSRWGLGVEGDWMRWSCYIHPARVEYRTQSLTVTFGPWYLSWRRCKPTQNAPSDSADA